LREIDNSVIETALLTEKGFDYAVYRNPERFDREVAAEIEAQVVARFGYEAAHYHERVSEDLADGASLPTETRTSSPRVSDAVLDEFSFANEEVEEFDWSMSLVERAVAQRADEFMMARRGIVKREYSALNDTFIARNIGTRPREIIYNSRYTSTIVVEATRAEIEAYAKMDVVEDISLYVELIVEPDACRVLEQIEVSGAGGTKGTFFNNTQGYRGTGIIIGVVEAGASSYRPEFDRNAPQLNGIGTTRLRFENDAGNNGGPVDLGNSTNRDHATLVTSIIIGRSVAVSNIRYEGVVPLATVIQTPVSNSNDVFRAIQQLANKSVHVINMSLGDNNLAHDTGYTVVDREVDRLISSTNTVIVVSAGNRGGEQGGWDRRITSPGKALDAITVGNADTRVPESPYPLNPYNDHPSSPRFRHGTFFESSFVHANILPNKPDILAPGRVGIVRNTNSVLIHNGTSLSAPLVTGVIAQMMQARVAIRSRPDIVKAMLLLGANPDVIRTNITDPHDSANNLVANHLWNRSGAGFLNAVRAVRIAESTRYNGGRLTSTVSRPEHSIGSYSVGQRIRIALTYLRSDNSAITSSLHFDEVNIRLIAPNGSVVRSSLQVGQNVGIMEYTVPSGGAGAYRVRIEPVRIKSPSVGVIYGVSWGLL
jgi:hypothetical protein